MTQHPLQSTWTACGAQPSTCDGHPVIESFGATEAECAAGRNGAGICEVPLRGLIEVTGRDRATWLNNYVTNTIRDLGPGEGNYAFVLDGKGRIQFDVNMIVVEGAICLDVDRRFVERALSHLDRYIITEDVILKDRSPACVRIGLLGPQAATVTRALGAGHAASMAALGSSWIELAGGRCLIVRNDFAGVFGVEFYVDPSRAQAAWEQLVERGASAPLIPVGREALEVLRVEAGLPSCANELTPNVLPAETGQVDRAVSFVKGCYLGQEIVERMRSRGSVARRLVGLTFADGHAIEPGMDLHENGQDVGRVTSVCRSDRMKGWIGLGYVKLSHSVSGTRLTADATSPVIAQVTTLPFPSR